MFALELCPFATKNEAYLFVDKLHDISNMELNENFFECVRKKRKMERISPHVFASHKDVRNSNLELLHVAIGFLIFISILYKGFRLRERIGLLLHTFLQKSSTIACM